jgi:hypothetical protein
MTLLSIGDELWILFLVSIAEMVYYNLPSSPLFSFFLLILWSLPMVPIGGFCAPTQNATTTTPTNHKTQHLPK